MPVTLTQYTGKNKSAKKEITVNTWNWKADGTRKSKETVWTARTWLLILANSYNTTLTSETEMRQRCWILCSRQDWDHKFPRVQRGEHLSK